MKKRYYIGLGTTFHDPAIAIADHNGYIIFAEASERHLQNKRAYNCPPDHINYLTDLIQQYCSYDSEFVVASSWSNNFLRILKLASLLGRYRFNSIRNSGSALTTLLMPWFYLPTGGSYMYQAQLTAGLGTLYGVNNAFGHLRVLLRRYDHHLTHAAHACYTSPFTEACCLVIDGMGESGSMAIYHFVDGRLRLIRRQYGFASLGLFYGFITELCGFSPMKGEEWKIMGLAPYGKHDQKIYDMLSNLITVTKGKLHIPRLWAKRKILDQIWSLRTNTSDDFQAAANIAFSGQRIFSELMTSVLKNINQTAVSENLVLCGGCALNSAYNGTILQKTDFKHLYVPSAPADDGNAIGAALLAYLQDNPSKQFSPGQYVKDYPYLGSGLSNHAIQRAARSGCATKVRELKGTVAKEAAKILAQGKVIGWLQGRAEFGPRALGNRSILSDPRDSSIRDIINEQIKFRESFRPFSPAILNEYGKEYFEDFQESPHMERALCLRDNKRSIVPAITHVDGTCRLQSVKKKFNPLFHNVLTEFHSLTNVPILLNTSYNIMGKPIVHSVEDAMGMFHTTGLDALVIHDFLFEK